MTAHLSVYGRLGRAPQNIPTRTGKAMSVASLAVEIDDRTGTEDSAPLWLDVVAFGAMAESLMRHVKGDLVSACGRLQRRTWMDSDGARREQLQFIAEQIFSARTVRPSGGRTCNVARPADTAFIDDEIAFFPSQHRGEG